MTHTIESLKATMRKAYDEGRLMAQEPGLHEDTEYYYKKGKYGCAVGVCLTSKQASNIGSILTLSTVQGERYFRKIFTDAEVFDFARDAQVAHDDWVYSIMWCSDGETISLKKNTFLSLIDHPKAV